eukprot:TRINITY_DN11029_c0_g1_i1.p1 TRINITY_DN11029_c0_g1~~TRINITY_DN11029_c0_g1_i1.p1  ORF type:complete len:221 (-),score=59.43 TRINITY_DN11029_c0_g1_i1:229-891(-)
MSVGNANYSSRVEDDGDSSQRRTLWIGGAVSYQVDEEMLYEIFNNAGPVEDIRIPHDKERNQNKNFAFVTFQHEESIPYAKALFQGLCLYGRELIIKEAGVGRSSGKSSHSRSISAPGIKMSHGAQNNNMSQIASRYPESQQRYDAYDHHTPSSHYPSQYKAQHYQESYDRYPEYNNFSREEDYNHHQYSSGSSRDWQDRNGRRERRYDRRSYEYDRYRS